MLLKSSLVADYILQKDPDGKYISLDLQKKCVTYHLRKDYQDSLDPEEWVRAYYVAKLLRENERV